MLCPGGSWSSVGHAPHFLLSLISPITVPLLPGQLRCSSGLPRGNTCDMAFSSGDISTAGRRCRAAAAFTSRLLVSVERVTHEHRWRRGISLRKTSPTCCIAPTSNNFPLLPPSILKMRGNECMSVSYSRRRWDGGGQSGRMRSLLGSEVGCCPDRLCGGYRPCLDFFLSLSLFRNGS